MNPAEHVAWASAARRELYLLVQNRFALVVLHSAENKKGHHVRRHDDPYRYHGAARHVAKSEHV